MELCPCGVSIEGTREPATRNVPQRQSRRTSLIPPSLQLEQFCTLTIYCNLESLFASGGQGDDGTLELLQRTSPPRCDENGDYAVCDEAIASVTNALGHTVSCVTSRVEYVSAVGRLECDDARRLTRFFGHQGEFTRPYVCHTHLGLDVQRINRYHC